MSKSTYRKRLRGMNSTSSWGVASNSRTGWKKNYRRDLSSNRLKFN